MRLLVLDELQLVVALMSLGLKLLQLLLQHLQLALALWDLTQRSESSRVENLAVER